MVIALLAGLDVACLIGALMALTAWKVFGAPGVAVTFVVVADFVGAVPTLRHSWVRPYEETWPAFALSSLSGVMTLLCANFAVLTAVAYPLYIALVDFAITLVLLVRPHRQRANLQPTPHLARSGSRGDGAARHPTAMTPTGRIP